MKTLVVALALASAILAEPGILGDMIRGVRGDDGQVYTSDGKDNGVRSRGRRPLTGMGGRDSVRDRDVDGMGGTGRREGMDGMTGGMGNRRRPGGMGMVDEQEGMGSMGGTGRRGSMGGRGDMGNMGGPGGMGYDGMGGMGGTGGMGGMGMGYMPGGYGYSPASQYFASMGVIPTGNGYCSCPPQLQMYPVGGPYGGPYDGLNGGPYGGPSGRSRGRPYGGNKYGSEEGSMRGNPGTPSLGERGGFKEEKEKEDAVKPAVTETRTDEKTVVATDAV